MDIWVAPTLWADPALASPAFPANLWATQAFSAQLLPEKQSPKQGLIFRWFIWGKWCLGITSLNHPPANKQEFGPDNSETLKRERWGRVCSWAVTARGTWSSVSLGPSEMPRRTCLGIPVMELAPVLHWSTVASWAVHSITYSDCPPWVLGRVLRKMLTGRPMWEALPMAEGKMCVQRIWGADKRILRYSMLLIL